MAYKTIPNVKKNSPPALLTSGITDSADTFPVDHLEYFHDRETGALILEGITIWDQADPDPTHREEITITGASDTTGAGNLTGGVRGVNADGTNGQARAFDAGAKIAVMFTTGIMNRIRDNFEAAVGTWVAFDPYPVWGTADPTISSTVARYVRNGNVVTFAASFIISDGAGASSLTLSLPVAAPQTANFYHPLISFKKITSGGSSLMSDPFAYIDYTEATPAIKFSQFGTLPSGYTAELRISGSYEVA